MMRGKLPTTELERLPSSESSLRRHLPHKWTIYEEAPMLRTGHWGFEQGYESPSLLREDSAGRCVRDADLEAGRICTFAVGSRT